MITGMKENHTLLLFCAPVEGHQSGGHTVFIPDIPLVTYFTSNKAGELII